MIDTNDLLGLISAFATNYCEGRFEKNFDVVPKGLVTDVLEIQPDHFVKSRAASAVHLPHSGDSRLDLQNPPLMPELVGVKFVTNRRTRPDQ